MNSPVQYKSRKNFSTWSPAEQDPLYSGGMLNVEYIQQ